MSSSAAADTTITTLRSPRRPTRTSPASPDAASMPISAPVARTVANAVSCQVGWCPRSTVSKTDPKSKNWAYTATDAATRTTMPASERRRTVRRRRRDSPRTFAPTTNSTAAAEISTSSTPPCSSPQNADR